MQWCTARAMAALALLSGWAAASGCSDEYFGVEPRIARLSLASGDGQTATIGALLPQPLVVRVVDQDNLPIEDAPITWQVTTGNGVVTPTADTTDANGYASTTFRLGGTLGVQTVSATLAGLNPVSFTATATPAPAAKLILVAGNGQTGVAGQTLPAQLQVRVTDVFDNPKAGVPVSFSVIGGGGSVSAASVPTDDQGIAKVSWTLGPAAGTQTVVAGSGTLPPVTFTATATSAGPGPGPTPPAAGAGLP